MMDIKAFRKANGLTQENLADYLGVGKAFISQVETGRSALSEVKYSMILNNSLGWDTSMLQRKNASKANRLPPLVFNDGEMPPKGIPLIPIEAVAGILSGNSISVMDYECALYDIPMFRGAEFLIQISGDSMQPKYYSGDIVACKRLPIDTFFQWNKVYVIDSEQGVIIKRVRPGRDDKHIILVSENEVYAPFELSLDKVYSIALVVGVVRAEW